LRSPNLPEARFLSIKRVLKFLGLFVLGTIAAVLCAAALYRYMERGAIARSRAIHTADGIESMEQVPVGGIGQWIEVRGESAKNPVLLFIHGGPGSAFMPVAREFQGPWEKYFTVVQWDQRGAGKTYSSNDREIQRRTMNLAQMNADTLEMTNYLRKRFGREKIFVLGHSWGSILGLRLAHDHPELLYAYIGVGQAVNSWDNEAVLYKDSMAEAQRTQNKKAIAELTSIAPYPSANITFQQIQTMRQWSGALIGPQGTDDSWMGPKALMLAPEYSLKDDVGWFRGLFLSVDTLLPDLSKMNFADLGYDYQGPIFFLEGRHDPYTPSSVAKDFFDKMNDPQKQFAWFEKSGHFPFAEEPQQFTDVLVQRLLPLAQARMQ
jgi:proline iminopeptidase